MQKLIAFIALFAVAIHAGQVRVAHAVPDAPQVDVYVDGVLIFNFVPFRQVTAYVDLPGGTYLVQVTPAGQTSPVVIQANVTIDFFTPFTIAAINTLANISATVLTDDLRFPRPGYAAVRFVHFSPDAPAVDVAVTNGPVLFSDVSYLDATSYIQVPGGVYDLEVRLAGTDTVVLPLPGVKLVDEVVYSAFAEGLVTGTGDQALTAVLHWDL